MTKATPVSRLLNPLSWALGVVLVLMAAVAMGGVLLSNRALSTLTKELEPAADANRAILADMVNMETSVRAYAQSGLTSNLTTYQNAQIALPVNQAVVREYAAKDPEVAAKVRVQDDAIDTWLRDFAEVTANRPVGPKTYNAEEYAQGTALFEEIRRAVADTDRVLDARVTAAQKQADERLNTTLVGTGLLALLGALVLYRVRERVVEEVQQPLIDLESVVHRLAGGEHSARAVEGVGPAEVQAVSESLNHLAESNERARAVEKHISNEMLHLDMARADFMSNVSHELRTPLTTIAGYLELVAEEFEGRLESRHQKMLDAADRNVGRLRGLIDDLLALTRAETSPVEQLAPTDLHTLVRDVVADQSMMAARRQVHVELGPATEGCTVMADSAMMTRVLINVLNNAVKFSERGDTVQVSVTRAGDDVLVKFVDEGIGIPASELVNVGSRFFRASNAIHKHVAGTGLGLRIGQTVVEKHHGSLNIESVEDEGTTVTLSLPAHRPSHADAPLADADEPA